MAPKRGAKAIEISVKANDGNWTPSNLVLYLCPTRPMYMKKIIFFLFFLQHTAFAQLQKMPAYPLITHSTYFSVWSFADELAEDSTRHWTGISQSLIGHIRVDGQDYRFMGQDTAPLTADQQWVSVNATQTRYQFACGDVDLSLTFTSPLLLQDLSLLSRPVTYISFRLRSNDGHPHKAEISFSVAGDLAVNTPGQPLRSQKSTAGPLSFLKTGTREQKIPGKKGDNLRIDWGWLYVAAPTGQDTKQHITGGKKGQPVFLQTDFAAIPVGEDPVEKLILIGYDERYSVQYFNRNLQPLWRTEAFDGIAAPPKNMETLMRYSYADYDKVLSRCDTFNKSLYAKALNTGGDHYAQLCVAAYRQSIAAHSLVRSPEGELLFLSKENLTYPSAPLYLLYNPTLVEGMLNGTFRYSEKDMPVEECGNMILLTAGITKAEKNTGYARRRWSTLGIWARCLEQSSNLSVRTIAALGAYGWMAQQLGQDDTAAHYKQLAKTLAKKWMSPAETGDHALAFDKKDSWSQKYSLIWDKWLRLDLFPAGIYEKETDWYLDSPGQMPLSDDNQTNQTTDGKKAGFRPRSAAGGYFIRMLDESWSARD